MRKTLLAGAAVLILAAGAGAALWYRHTRGKPEYALRQIAAAVAAHDLLAFEVHFDTKRVAQSVADQIVTSAVGEATRGTASQSGFEALGTMLGAQMLQGMKPMLITTIEQSVAATVRGDPPPRQNATTARLMSKPVDLRPYRDGFRGIASVEQRENLALVRLRVKPEGRDSVAIVTLRMERTDGVWKVIAIEDVADLLREPAAAPRSRPLTTNERMEYAWQAAMKSDLRNLVTAEEAYFADSVKYTTDLGLLYVTTTGVTGPTIRLTNDGYTAWVGSTNTSKTCAIYIGFVKLPPAVIEGEPRCREGRPTPPPPASKKN